MKPLFAVVMTALAVVGVAYALGGADIFLKDGTAGSVGFGQEPPLLTPQEGSTWLEITIPNRAPWESVAVNESIVDGKDRITLQILLYYKEKGIDIQNVLLRPPSFCFDAVGIPCPWEVYVLVPDQNVTAMEKEGFIPVTPTP